MPSYTPAHFSTPVADGGPGDADSTNTCSARPAAVGYLRDYGVSLLSRRNRHCLCRRCDGESQSDKCNQLDHQRSPILHELLAEVGNSIRLSGNDKATARARRRNGRPYRRCPQGNRTPEGWHAKRAFFPERLFLIKSFRNLLKIPRRLRSAKLKTPPKRGFR